MKIYKADKVELSEMKLFLRTVGDEDIYHDINGDVESRIPEIENLIDQLQRFRKECWKYIDAQKNASLIKPLVEEIEKLYKEREEIKKWIKK